MINLRTQSPMLLAAARMPTALEPTNGAPPLTLELARLPAFRRLPPSHQTVIGLLWRRRAADTSPPGTNGEGTGGLTTKTAQRLGRIVDRFRVQLAAVDSGPNPENEVSISSWQSTLHFVGNVYRYNRRWIARGRENEVTVPQLQEDLEWFAKRHRTRFDGLVQRMGKIPAGHEAWTLALAWEITRSAGRLRVLAKEPLPAIAKAARKKFPPIPLLSHTAILRHPAWSEADRESIAQFFAVAEKKMRGLTAYKKKLRQVVSTLAALNPESLAVLARTVGPHSAAELFNRYASFTIPLMRAGAFLIRHRGKFVIEGSVLEMFVAHSGDKHYFHRLTAAVTSGRIAQLICSGGHYRVVARPKEPAPDTVAFSYRDRERVSFRPHPGNGWCAADLQLPRAAIVGWIHRVFQDVRRGRTSHQMVQLFDTRLCDYLKWVRGIAPVPDRYLSDAILDRVGIDEILKEELRHVNTLHRLLNSVAYLPGLGPYAEAGMLLRYLRLGSEIREYDALASKVEKDPRFWHDYQRYEAGWVRLASKEAAIRLLMLLDVPAAHRTACADYLLKCYDTIDNRIADQIPAGREVLFPNASWDLPYVRRSEASIRSDILKIVAAAQALQLNQLCLLRAALELKRHPIPAMTVYRVPGMMLRYARSLIPGLDTNKARAAFMPDGPERNYTYCEEGLMAMPHGALVKMGRRLAAERIMTLRQASEWVAHIEGMYAALQSTKDQSSQTA